MSKLIVEVCQIDSVENHPNADRMAIATLKGWKTCIGKNPDTGETSFKAGDKCVFFPPDSVLPPCLANGPNDEVPGRLDCMKYLHALPKNEQGIRPDGGRVVAARLRGHVSYGVIMPIDPKFGDDPNWEVGRDVAEYFGITKFEPPLESTEGDAEKSHPKFHAYTSIENIGNYPAAIPDGTEVIFTEKIHGKNCRVGCILDSDDQGNCIWNFAAGSHGVRRKRLVRIEHRFKVPDLIEDGFCDLVENSSFTMNGRNWRVESIIPAKPDVPESVERLHCFQIDGELNPVYKISEYWEPLEDEKVKGLIEFVRDEFPWPEQKFSVLLFGEIFGAGVQDMQYGLKGRSFRVFDLAINGLYVNFDDKTELFTRFGIVSVPILYRGPFSRPVMEQHTSGPTTMCAATDAGTFKGREGIVITPIKEVHYCDVLNGRRILKSISADYLARKGGTEFH